MSSDKKKGVLITVHCHNCNQPDLCTYTVLYDRIEDFVGRKSVIGDKVELRCIHNGGKRDMTIASTEEIIYNEPT